VIKASIENVGGFYTVAEAYKIFESGAAAGYLNQNYYSIELNQEYIDNFKKIVKKIIERAGS
jgi:DNA modification methylase